MSTKPKPIVEATTASRIDAEFNALMANVKPLRSDNNGAMLTAIPVAHDLWEVWQQRDHQADSAPAALQKLRVDLARALFADTTLPPVFDHAADPAALREIYYALEARMLCEDSGSNQEGFGSLLSNVRQAVIESTAFNQDGPQANQMPRQVNFMAHGIGYRAVPLVAQFAPAGQQPDLGRFDLSFADAHGKPGIPIGHMAVDALTGGKTPNDALAALLRLHRLGRYGEGMSRFGNWFTADGEGRELTAAMVAGFVNRVMPDVANGMGGVSPRFALTQAGVEHVICHPKLATAYEHYNKIEETTATLVDGDLRVRFDTDTGAILGRIDTAVPYMLAYIVRDHLGGVAAGKEYSRDELGYLLSLDLQHHRAQQVRLEEDAANMPALIELSEAEFDAYGLRQTSRSGTTNYELDEVLGVDMRHVWTILDSEPTEPTEAVPGIQTTGAIGYAITEKPWPHENMVAIYMDSLEDDCAPKP